MINIWRERPSEKVGNWNFARAICACDDNSCVISQHHGWVVIGRVGMREIAAYRRQISHQRVSNHFGGIGQQWVLFTDQGRTVDIGFTGHGPNF